MPLLSDAKLVQHASREDLPVLCSSRLAVSHHHRWMMGNLSNLGSVWGRARCVQAADLPPSSAPPQTTRSFLRRRTLGAAETAEMLTDEGILPSLKSLLLRFLLASISSVLEDVCRTRPSGRDNEANGSVTLETKLKGSSNGRTPPFPLRLQVLFYSPA